MDNKNKILFDPGYAPLIINSIGQVGYTYYMFDAIGNVKIKRQNFLTVSIKLEKLLKENISFYLGCLLWASYISGFDNYEIEGNQLLGEQCEEKEYTSEIDFLIDFVENKYNRDYKYYKNKLYIPDEKYLPILKTYRNFLTLNKGFVNCSNTSQIILPDNLKKLSPDKREYVNKEIQNIIASKNLTKLLDYYDLIF